MTHQCHEELLHFLLCKCCTKGDFSQEENMFFFWDEVLQCRPGWPTWDGSFLLLPSQHWNERHAPPCPAEEIICISYLVLPENFPGEKIPTRRDLSKCLLLVTKSGSQCQGLDPWATEMATQPRAHTDLTENHSLVPSVYKCLHLQFWGALMPSSSLQTPALMCTDTHPAPEKYTHK